MTITPETTTLGTFTPGDFRDILRRPGVLALPGVFDGISARAANSVGPRRST